MTSWDCSFKRWNSCKRYRLDKVAPEGKIRLPVSPKAEKRFTDHAHQSPENRSDQRPVLRSFDAHLLLLLTLAQGQLERGEQFSFFPFVLLQLMLNALLLLDQLMFALEQFQILVVTARELLHFHPKVRQGHLTANQIIGVGSTFSLRSDESLFCLWPRIGEREKKKRNADNSDVG